jgi:UDP-GlcNAc:undecaprenyl-phosphate/decaprenyl-phosphate GlcNAc-1-phosphate transferase
MNPGILFTLFALITSFLITFKAIPAIIKVAHLKGLTDQPDGDRKLHKKIIPTLGGVGMFAGFMVSYGIWIGFYMPHYISALVAAVTILFFVGIKDDILVISPYKKLIGQIIAAVVIVFFGGVHIPGLDGLFGIQNFPFYTSKLFSVFAIIIIINAYNLIDGVDGLAGIVSLVGSYAMGVWFLWGGHYPEAILCFALAGALVGFMFHNFEPAKIFMGDTGSLIIGFILSVSGFRLVQLNGVTGGLALDAPAIFVFSIMIIPMFDTFRVICIRMLNGRSPLKADSNHLHHFLLRLGLRHYQVALTLGIANLAIILVSLLINSWNVYLYFGALVLMSLTIIPIVRAALVIVSLRQRIVGRRLQRALHFDDLLPDHVIADMNTYRRHQERLQNVKNNIPEFTIANEN